MNIDSWYNNILWVGFFIDFSFLIICLVLCTRRYQPKYIKAFIILAFANLPFGLATIFIVYNPEQKKELLYLISGLIIICEPVFELIFFTYLFRELIPSSNVKKGTFISLGLFAILYFLSIITHHHFQVEANFSNELWVLSVLVLNLTLIGLSLVYYKKLFEVRLFQNLSAQPSFWIVTGIFFYFTTELVTDVFTDYFFLNNMQRQAHRIFSINFFAELIEYMLYTKAFLCKRKTS